jgi:hypothetical protein
LPARSGNTQSLLLYDRGRLGGPFLISERDRFGLFPKCIARNREKVLDELSLWSRIPARPEAAPAAAGCRNGCGSSG